MLQVGGVLVGLYWPPVVSGRLENEISGSLVWTYGNTDSECTQRRLSLNIAIKYSPPLTMLCPSVNTLGHRTDYSEN